MNSARPNLTTATLLLALFGAFFYVQHDDAQQAQADEDIAALHSRNWAARQVCGPDAEPEWVEDKTLVCHRVINTTVLAARP
jgi:hypothetical protein